MLSHGYRRGRGLFQIAGPRFAVSTSRGQPPRGVSLHRRESCPVLAHAASIDDTPVTVGYFRCRRNRLRRAVRWVKVFSLEAGNRRCGSALVCYRKGTVSTMSKPYQRVTGDSVAQPNCQNALFSRYLRCLEYASSNQGVGGSNPFGRTFYQRTPRLPWPRDRNEQIEPLTDNRRFDYPAPRRVGRRRFCGGGPQRSGGRGEQPRAIRPGAPFKFGRSHQLVGLTASLADGLI